ncbi:MAG: AAA family ATPase, partial [Spirochaetes bacterium]|nr:AAA family ATPase [Spirochaetota bacterium]
SEKIGKLETLVRVYETELIIDALKQTQGNQRKAAQILETTKRIIQYKISQYQIDYERYKKNELN